MASIGKIESIINGVPAALRVPLLDAFREVLKMRFGRAGNNVPAENFTGGYYETTTPSTPGEEFSIAHGFGKAPYLAQSVLQLGAGWQQVPLTATKAPDSKRVYLSSTVADAPVTIYLEA